MKNGGPSIVIYQPEADTKVDINPLWHGGAAGDPLAPVSESSDDFFRNDFEELD
jgi:hypothetical protein